MITWNCAFESQENCLVKEYNNLITQHRLWWILLWRLW